MARVYKEEIVRVFVTPEELRGVASQLEDQWSRASVGDYLPSRSWIGDGGLVFKLILDEERMPNRG